MDYAKIVNGLREWHKNMILDMCRNEDMKCYEFCGYCMGQCIPLQASNAIVNLFEEAQAQRRRAEKAEWERDAAIADIKHIVCDLYEDDVLCKEFCKNHDGVCSSKAELGLYEDCRGFECRGVQED